MKGIAIFIAGLAAGAVLVVAAHAHRPVCATDATGAPAHTRSEFSFTVHAPIEVAAPLFGAEAERSWGGESWNPSFVYPQPASDVRGAVFFVKHGGHDSTWVATAQDFRGGHVQYVNIIDGAMATLIDIRLRAASEKETAVNVVYERTSLRAELNEHIKELGAADKTNGGHWSDAINGFLQASSPHAQSKQ